jgi:hypothetical protein
MKQLLLFAFAAMFVASCSRNEQTMDNRHKIGFKVVCEHAVSVSHSGAAQDITQMVSPGAEYSYEYLAAPGDSLYISAQGKPMKWYRLDVYIDGYYWMGVGAGCGGYERIAWMVP